MFFFFFFEFSWGEMSAWFIMELTSDLSGEERKGGNGEKSVTGHS